MKIIPNAYKLLEKSMIKPTKLKVSNLPLDFTSDELASLFDSYGIVRKTEVLFNKIREYEGKGYVELDKVAAERAIKDLKYSPVKGKLLKIVEVGITKEYPTYQKPVYVQREGPPEAKGQWKRQAEAWEQKFRPKK